MTEREFWSLFDTAREQAGDAETYENDGPQILQELLEKLSAKEIESFNTIFNRKYYAAYRWDLWAAAYIIGGGCSDDGFMDFRSELISRGQAVYEAALKDPESLADVEPSVEGLEGWQYVAGRAYTEKTGDELPDNGERQAEEPMGERWDEDNVSDLFPRLAEKFN
ncbi:MAG: DUF4240 domain-containing protein [Planctomycetota bacterium]